MKEFEIWVEGYVATGESGSAYLLGRGLGDTFNDAVINYMTTHSNHGIEENKPNRYMTEDAYKNRRSNWNIWACNLYDNEIEARKSFG